MATVKEHYINFLKLRDNLLKTYEDYPYGKEWTEQDVIRFEDALADYTEGYNSFSDLFFNKAVDIMRWKSEETKKEFIDGLKNVLEADMKIFNCLRIRFKWHKEFELNQASILKRLARSISSDLFIQVPRGKNKFYIKALMVLIDELSKENLSLKYLNSYDFKNRFTFEWLLSMCPELYAGHFTEDDFNKVLRAYKKVKSLSIRIFDGLTSTNETKGFDGYGFKGKKYVPSYCSGGIDLNRQDWIRLKDAYEDITDSLDHGIIRDKKYNYGEI